MTQASPHPKPTISERLSALITAYGPIAVGVWFTLFGITLGLSYLGLQLGFGFESATSTSVGALGAYGITQLTKPIRLLLTLALTPFVAHVFGRKDKAHPEEGSH